MMARGYYTTEKLVLPDCITLLLSLNQFTRLIKRVVKWIERLSSKGQEFRIPGSSVTFGGARQLVVAGFIATSNLTGPL